MAGAEQPGADQPGQHSYPTPQEGNDEGHSYPTPQDVLACICGQPFEQVLSKNCYDGKGVRCDLCSKLVKADSVVYHCPNESTTAHGGGYDLCATCATKEMLTVGGTEGGDDHLHVDGKPKLLIPKGYTSQSFPPCICGKELQPIAANKAYSGSDGIECDNCSKTCNGDYVPIYHCMDVKSSKHDGGYDLCFDCGWIYVSHKMDEFAAERAPPQPQPGTLEHEQKIKDEEPEPLCICGVDLAQTDSTVYGAEMCVECDWCGKQCRNADVVYHCPRGKNATEHSNGFDLCERCANRTNWLSDLFEDMVVTIARFLVNRRPSSLLYLKSINQHWYQCLNPNKPNVNALWQHNICRPMFPHIPKELRMKRWDRYYQYRYHSILRWRKEHNDHAKINKTLVYTKYKLIENCTHDRERLNAFYRDPLVFQKEIEEAVDGVDTGVEQEYNGYFNAQFGAHGLPKGYQWKLECPVMTLNLKKRGDDKYYCGVCKKHVYEVHTEKQMAARVSQGQCVQFTMSGKEVEVKPTEERARRRAARARRRERDGDQVEDELWIVDLSNL